MDFILNELSLHGQFIDIDSFWKAFHAIKKIQQILDHFGYNLKLHRMFHNKYVIENSLTVRNAIRSLPIDKRRSVMSWLTTTGPFWSDDQQHDVNDNISIDDQDITDSALAEAAYHYYLGEITPTVSFSPSNWEFNPICACIDKSPVNIDNFWEYESLENFLVKALPEPNSWKKLEQNVKTSFPELTILENAFSFLNPVPFSKHVSKEIFHLLGVLNFLKSHFDAQGKPTAQWEEMYQAYFIASRPRFSDSSDSEKKDFSPRLHFRDPQTNKPLFCPWHGKIHSPQIRIHFSFPITADSPLFVAYIGPKITKR